MSVSLDVFLRIILKTVFQKSVGVSYKNTSISFCDRSYEILYIHLPLSRFLESV